MLERAWGIIANAADWGLTGPTAKDWVVAAEHWRDDWHAHLDGRKKFA